jgi:hypothetical protein
MTIYRSNDDEFGFSKLDHLLTRAGDKIVLVIEAVTDAQEIVETSRSGWSTIGSSLSPGDIVYFCTHGRALEFRVQVIK